MNNLTPALKGKSISERILLFLFIILIYALSIHQIVDNDVFLHIKTGEYILKNRAVPSVDIFSYTIKGRPWLNNQWFADIVFYILYSILNINGLILFKASVICAAFLIMLFTYYKRNEYSWFYFFIAALAVISSSGRFIVRPENFTLLFIAILLYIFNKQRSLLFLVPIIQVFWVNMHGGFILGLALTALFVAGETLESRLPYFRKYPPEAKKGKPWPLFLLLAAVFSACLINPYGYKVILNTLPFAQSRFLRSCILEWLPSFLNISMNRLDVMVAFASLIILSTVTFILNIKKAKPFLSMCLLMFLYLAISARRNIALFSIIAPVFIGLAITQIMDSCPSNFRRMLLKSKSLINASLAVSLCILIYLVVANIYYTRIGVPQNFGLGISEVQEPVGACDFIRDNKIKGKLFNDYDFGAYIIYALYPQLKVFIDGRIDTYGAGFYLRDYEAFFNDSEGIFKDANNKYGIDIFLLKMGKDNPIKPELLKDANYRLVYFDRASLIFLKDSAQNKDVIKQYAIDTSDTRKLEDYVLRRGGPHTRSYGFDFLSRLLGGLSSKYYYPLAEYQLGIFYRDIGAFELSREQFEEGIRVFPENKILRYELGNLYFRSGRLDEAMDAYRQVLRYDKKDYKVFKVLGDIYVAKKDFKNAVLEYERSVKINPLYDAGVYKTLGMLYKFYLNDSQKAEGYFLRYSQLRRDIKER